MRTILESEGAYRRMQRVCYISSENLEFLLDARPNDKMTVEELEELTPWSKIVQECCVNKLE